MMYMLKIFAQDKSDEVIVKFSDFKKWTEGETHIYLFVGRPEIYYKNTYISADSVVGWAKDTEKDTQNNKKLSLVISEIYAEGSVKLKKGDKEIWGDRIFYNLKTEQGIILNFELKTINKERNIPVIVKAKEAREISKNHYILKNGSTTTCDYGEPHYDLSFKSADLFLETTGEKEKFHVESLYGKGYTVYPTLYNIPFFFLPVLPFYSEREPLLRSIKLGKSRRFGYYDETKWGIDIKKGDIDKVGLYKDTDENDDTKKWGNLILEQYYRSKRGQAYGLDFDYKWQNYNGFLYSYYMRDEGPDTHIDFDKRFLPLENHDRGRIKFFHRQEVTNNIRAEAELSYLSDRNLLEEFFPKEFKEGKEQETVLYLRWLLRENMAFTYLERHRLNDFQTQNEYLPQTKLNLISEPVINSPVGWIYFSSSNDLTNIRKLYDNELNLSSQHIWRFDSQNDFTLPFDFKLAQVHPFVSERITTFEDTLEKDSETRFISTYGISTNSQLRRVYDVDNDFLNIHKLRHIMDFEMRFTNNFYTNTHKSELIQFDSMDAVDEFKELAFGLQNRFQTKVKNGDKMDILEFLDINCGIEYYPNYDRDTTSFEDTNFLPPFNWITLPLAKDSIYRDRKYSNIYSSLRFKPTKYFYLYVSDEYNPNNGDEEIRNATINIKPIETMDINIGQSFSKNITNTYGINFSWKLADVWSLGFSNQYDFKNDRTIKEALFINREFHDFFLGFTLENNPTRGEKQILFNIIPKFLGKKDFTK